MAPGGFPVARGGFLLARRGFPLARGGPPSHLPTGPDVFRKMATELLNHIGPLHAVAAVRNGLPGVELLGGSEYCRAF